MHGADPGEIGRPPRLSQQCSLLRVREYSSQSERRRTGHRFQMQPGSEYFPWISEAMSRPSSKLSLLCKKILKLRISTKWRRDEGAIRLMQWVTSSLSPRSWPITPPRAPSCRWLAAVPWILLQSSVSGNHRTIASYNQVDLEWFTLEEGRKAFGYLFDEEAGSPWRSGQAMAFLASDDASFVLAIALKSTEEAQSENILINQLLF